MDVTLLKMLKFLNSISTSQFIIKEHSTSSLTLTSAGAQRGNSANLLSQRSTKLKTLVGEGQKGSKM